MARKWFRKAVMKKPPYKLGWGKRQKTSERRRNAISSRPKGWSLRRKRLSAGRALIALANVTKDRKTRELARKDAKHFFSLLKPK